MVGPNVDTHALPQCSHASVGLAQARPKYEVDIGGRGQTAKTMHWIICSCALPQFLTPDLRVVKTAHLVRNTFKLGTYVFEYQPLPLVSIHVVEPVFANSWICFIEKPCLKFGLCLVAIACLQSEIDTGKN